MTARRVLVGLVAASVGIAGCAVPGSIGGSREITAVFDDVGDLVSGHSVQVADVRVGSVTGIELTEDFQAEVTMVLADSVFVPRDSLALLRTTSLLGEKFVELRPLGDDPMAGDNLQDGDVIGQTAQAPELEFVAEQAVEVLGAVLASDVAALVEAGAVGFAGRADELTAIVDNLSIISGTLAEQTDELVRIIDALDGTFAALAADAGDLGAMLEQLATTTQILADNREVAVDAVRQLTRLAEIQNETVFEPYLDRVHDQIRHLDAILAEVDRNQGQVADLLYWLGQFADLIARAAPNDFAQIYGLVETVEQ